jgi:hypothetical protein
MVGHGATHVVVCLMKEESSLINYVGGAILASLLYPRRSLHLLNTSQQQQQATPRNPLRSVISFNLHGTAYSCPYASQSAL